MRDGKRRATTITYAHTHPPCASQGKASAARCLTPVATIPAIGVLVGSTIPFSLASRSTSCSTSAEDAPPWPIDDARGEGRARESWLGLVAEALLLFTNPNTSKRTCTHGVSFIRNTWVVDLTLVFGDQEHDRRGKRVRTSLVVMVLLTPVPRKM